MKKLLASVVAFCSLLITANSQTIAPVRQSAIGISFTLTDFITAQRIRSSSLSSVLSNKEWAKVKDMAPGFALSYYRGLMPKIDFAATFNGTFVDMPLPDKPDDGSTHFLGELDASAQFKLVNENYWFIPYADLGIGAHVYKSYYGAFLPIGIGFRINFFDEAGININSQYRIPVTPETGNYHFFHQLGVYGIIGPKKEVAKAAPVVPAIVPKDSDGDGIIDDNDKCPNVPGTAKYDGCPIPDSDKDGINDEEDKCPTVPGVARYQGCPVPDTDKDGINDEEDKCPNEAGVARYQGCPVPDTDGDGVNDEDDKCPNEKGSPENFGCPKLEEYKFDARKVQFVTGSAKLTKSAMAELDKGAQILQDHPKINISIEGHTDNTGSAAGNQKLSEQRAAAVKAYLVKKGVSGERMSTAGYGQTKPVADNKTAKGRAANRRVEFKMAQ
jgi:outer membrane protein OmpA-like peptidoglycan-associated protein